MCVIQEIIKFSDTLEPWQRDVIRRLYEQVDFTEKDRGEALAMLKAHHGVSVGEPTRTPQPLADEDVQHRPDDDLGTILNSIGNIKHTNRLAKEQTLNFATDGITLIYGDNGSGKSGYARVLKAVCRVRAGGAEPIRGNVFAAEEHPPAEAIIRYTHGPGEPQPVHWRDGGTPPDELSRVSVFDARTVPLYANKEGQIEFLPQGLDLLERLGDVCKTLGQEIDAEISSAKRQVDSPLPVLAAGTTAAEIVARLKPERPVGDLPSAVAIRAAGIWEEKDKAGLGEVLADLAADPKVLAARCRSARDSVAQLAASLQSAEKLLGDAAPERLRKAVDAAKAAREAADLSAERAFANEALSGVGSQPWRLMFTYAREYSAVAYPGEPFPVTGPGKQCLLCQQPLGDAASDRLQRFEAFVTDRAQTEADRQEKAIADATAEIQTLQLRSASDAETMLGGLLELDRKAKGLDEKVVSYLSALVARRSEILTAMKSGHTFGELSILPRSPLEDLSSTSARLDAKVTEYEATESDPEQRKAMQAQRDELQARKTLSENLPSVLTRRYDIVQLATLRACRSACDTTAISRKNTKLRRRFVTADFEQQFLKERKRFDLTHLPMYVQDRSDHGASKRTIALNATIKVQNKDILSEGEFSALALACFLAEVGSIPRHNGIIVDDPVSSLDHLRTRRVASRLVDEAAKERQVIVFTHDLVFYYELISVAGEAGVPMTKHWIRCTEGGEFGVIHENDEPWEAKKVKQRLGDLDGKLGSVRKIVDMNSTAYRDAIVGFYTGLRETWERLVEELLFNGVVGRFEAGVKTQSLKGAQITNEDYRRVFFGMKKASEYSGHDRTKARQVSPPKPDEVECDLQGLRTYVDELRARKKKLEDDRRTLEQPPVGNVA